MWSLSTTQAQSCFWFRFDSVAVLCLCLRQESPLCSSLPTGRFHRYLVTRANSCLLVSTCAPPSLVVFLSKIPPSTQSSSTYPIRHRSMAMTLCRSNTDFLFSPVKFHLYSPSPITSTGTFKLEYTPEHTELFLDQVHANVLGGFMPNTNSPDPNFGNCLQCIAIDRARYQVKPPVARSSICTQCFQQYCFDPSNLTSAAALTGRKLVFVDPDPQGVSALSGFLSQSKVGLILGFIGLLLVVAGLSAFLCVYSPPFFGIGVDSDVPHTLFFW